MPQLGTWSSLTPPQEDRTPSRGWKSRFPTQACQWGWGPVFSLWHLDGLEWLLSVSFVALAVPFLIFWLKRAGFCRGFLVCVHWFFWVVGFSSTQCGLNEIRKTRKQKTNHGTHSYVLCQVAESLTSLLSSIHISQSSYVCFIYNVQGFNCTLMERCKEKYGYSVCPEAEVSSSVHFKLLFSLKLF